MILNEPFFLRPHTKIFWGDEWNDTKGFFLRRGLEGPRVLCHWNNHICQLKWWHYYIQFLERIPQMLRSWTPPKRFALWTVEAESNERGKVVHSHSIFILFQISHGPKCWWEQMGSWGVTWQESHSNFLHKTLQAFLSPVATSLLLPFEGPYDPPCEEKLSQGISSFLLQDTVRRSH